MCISQSLAVFLRVILQGVGGIISLGVSKRIQHPNMTSTDIKPSPLVQDPSAKGVVDHYSLGRLVPACMLVDAVENKL